MKISRTPYSADSALEFVNGLLVGIGSQIMMDFGLAGLFDRFEKEFGRSVTKTLLGLIGVTIVVVCLSLIVQPIYSLAFWATQTAIGQFTTETAVKIIAFVLGFASIVCTVIFVGDVLHTRIAVHTIRDVHDLRDETHKILAELREFLEEGEAFLQANQDLLQSAIAKLERATVELGTDHVLAGELTEIKDKLSGFAEAMGQFKWPDSGPLSPQDTEQVTLR